MRRLTGRELVAAMREGREAQEEKAAAIGDEIRRKGDINWDDVKRLTNLGYDLLPALRRMMRAPCKSWRGLSFGLGIIFAGILLACLAGLA